MASGTPLTLEGHVCSPHRAGSSHGRGGGGTGGWPAGPHCVGSTLSSHHHWGTRAITSHRTAPPHPPWVASCGKVGTRPPQGPLTLITSSQWGCHSLRGALHTAVAHTGSITREAISSHSRETCCRSGHPSPRKNIPSHGVSPTQGGTTGGHGTWRASPHTSQSRPSLTQAEAISQGDVPSEWLLPHKGGSPHLTGVITSHNVSPHTGGTSPHGGHHSSRGGSPHTMCPLTWGGTSLQRGQHSSRSGERSPLTHVPSHGTAS